MFLIDIFKTIVLGIVEGITEWLPISSTGHMILFNEFMGTKDGFFGSQIYLYVIQLGAILAIVTLYFKKLNPFSPSKTPAERLDTYRMWLKVIIACIPAAVFGLLLNDYMDQISNALVVSITLIIYGVAFIFIENSKKNAEITDMNDLSYKTAFLIGLFQVLSIIPGTSRSGATILGAMLLCCSRDLAAEFSFFLAIPVMVGVSILKIGSYFLDVRSGVIPPIASADWLLLLIGMVVAYVISIVSVKMLMNYVRNHDFKVFGKYRIVLGFIVLVYFMINGNLLAV